MDRKPEVMMKRFLFPLLWIDTFLAVVVSEPEVILVSAMATKPPRTFIPKQ